MTIPTNNYALTNPFTNLPTNALFNIFQQLDSKDLGQLQCVSKLFRNILNDRQNPVIQNLWKAKALQKFAHSGNSVSSVEQKQHSMIQRLIKLERGLCHSEKKDLSHLHEDFLSDLPAEVLLTISEYLSIADSNRLKCVSRVFRNTLKRNYSLKYLPHKILFNIFEHLDGKDLGRLECTSKVFKEILNDEENSVVKNLWKNKVCREFPLRGYSRDEADKKNYISLIKLFRSRRPAMVHYSMVDYSHTHLPYSYARTDIPQPQLPIYRIRSHTELPHTQPHNYIDLTELDD